MKTVSRTALEGHIARVIERMKDMQGSIQETAPIGIITMAIGSGRRGDC
ncbi:hypothetical protein NSU18_24070 [Paenibacillus sp. FSL H8-0048]